MQLRSGYDFRTARRSLNLLTIEWANRGINLWTIEQGTIVMNTGQATYPLPVDTIDLLDTVVRQNNGTTNQIDINISRISEPTYMTLPNKLAQGRPIQVYVNRQSGQENPTTVILANPGIGIGATDTTIQLSSVEGLSTSGFIKIGSETISYPNIDPVNKQLINCARGQNNTTAAAHLNGAAITVQNLPCINVWPTANAGGGYTFVYWRMRRIQDAGGGIRTQDIPFRFLPCLVAGLAYYVGMKKPEVPPERLAMLKQNYEEQWKLAADEDREKANLRLAPRQMFW